MSRRKRPTPERMRPPRRTRWRLPVRRALLFAGTALLANAVVGDRGLLELMRAKREDRTLATAISTLRRENRDLREQARRLREDPTTIEALARRELGLLRPGELLVIVGSNTGSADTPPVPAGPTARPGRGVHR
jgi:cell division protein FtsB